MNQVDLKVTPSSIELPLDNADEYLRVIEDRFSKYMQGASDAIRSGKLVVAVSLTDQPVGDEDDHVHVVLHLSGELDGKSIAYETTSERSVPTPYAARRRVYEEQRAALAVSSGFLGVAMRRAILALFPGSRDRQPKQKHLNEMISAVVVESLGHIDRTIGRQTTNNGARWNKLRAAAILLSAALVPVWALIYVRAHPHSQGFGDTWGVGLIVGGMALIPMLGLFYAIAMISMPSQFYSSEVAGQKVAPNKKQAVSTAILIIFLTGGMLGGCAYMALFMFQ